MDVLITAAIVYYLQMSRTGFERMDHLIDVLLVYTFNNVSICSSLLTKSQSLIVRDRER